MMAIIAFTGASTALVTCLAIAALNVVVRRESANIVEKQIQLLVQATRSVAPAILDRTGACTATPSISSFKWLQAYTDEAFPRARLSLTEETRPAWLEGTSFTGVVVYRGRLEIRNVVVQQKDACNVTAIFSLPLGSELARRLSSASGMSVKPVSPQPFLVHSPQQRVLRTIEGNFLPGVSRPTAVVLTVRDWETGAPEDWVAYSVQPSYFATFEDVARLGSQMANWVWLFAALSLTVLLLEASGVWMSIRLGSNITAAIDDLSSAARKIASGDFTWRTPVRSNDQMGELVSSFNEMAISLERLKKEEAAKLRLESELQVARSVQQNLFPRAAPVLRGASIAGRTLEARTIGGDLYDFFDLTGGRIGILCADISGKGIPAALMMANLQAIARARGGDGIHGPAAGPAHFVELLNQQLAGRFGDSRYATLFWGDYNAETGALTYINAGQPSPILIRSTGVTERLESDGFPVGMFANARYTARDLQVQPGDRLVIFSDGVTDAQNAEEDEFGDQRLIDCCKSIAAGVDADGVADRILRDVAEWSVGTEQFDDTTVVVMNVAPAT